MRKPRKFEEPEIKYIIESYKSGRTLAGIGLELDRHAAAVHRVLKREGITGRSIRRYTIDEKFFSPPLVTEEQKYWLGFILADGVIRPNMLVVKLQAGDFHHLEKLKASLSSNHPLKFATEIRKGGSSHDSVTVSLCSIKLVKSLSEYGVVQNKVHKTFVPEFLSKDRHFWRGVFDGDGGFNPRSARYGWRTGLTGSEDVVRCFRDFISSHTGALPKLRQVGETFSVQFGGNGVSQEIARLLYTGSTVYLDRKALLVEDLLKLKVQKRNCRKTNVI